LDEGLRVILIGGSSHAGKSSVAARLARRLGWEAASTDYLARHPGRPWAQKPLEVRPHVAEHYLTLSVDELIASVLAHYRNIWPLAEVRVRERVAGGEALVLEGSALWPPLVAQLRLPEVAAVWLTTSPAIFETRMRRESAYEAADARGRRMIDQFLARTLRYDTDMKAEVDALGLPLVEIAPGDDVDAVADRCLAGMRPLG
jgi:2-phosphoglycerate kinase